MSKFIIKPMETEDEINGKAYVHYKSWHETYTDLVDADFLKEFTLEKTKQIAHGWLNNILIAKDGDRIIGFVGYGDYHDNSLCEYGEIYGIYVLADYHVKKVGYELMNAAIEKLVEYNKIALWVLKGNTKAIRFYERYGFHFDGFDAEIILGTPNTELRMIYERD